MEFFSGSNDLGTLGLGLLIAGAAAGLFSGVLGRGGGLVLVPALFLVARAMGLPPDKAMAMAAGTSFLCLVPLSLSTLAAQRFDRPATRRFRSWIWPGVIVALAITGTALPGLWQVWLFAATAATAVVLMLAAWEPRSGPGPYGAGGAATAIACALLAMLTGVAGPCLIAPSAMAWGSKRQEANGIAADRAVWITILGALAAVIVGWNTPDLPRYSYGYVNLLAFGVVAPVAFATHLIGTHYADALDAKKLRLIFALFVVVSAGRMLWSVMG